MKRGLCLKMNFTLLSLCLTFSLLSLFGVGFCSWFVTGGDKATADPVQVDIGNVIDIRPYTSIDYFDMFHYCRKGVIQDYETGTKGKMCFGFTLNMKHGLYAMLQDKSRLDLKVTLSLDDSSLLQYLKDGDNASKIGISFSTENYQTEPSLSFAGDFLDDGLFSLVSCTDSVLISGDYLYCSVFYSFDFSSATDFESEVYDKLRTTEFQFLIEAEI